MIKKIAIFLMTSFQFDSCCACRCICKIFTALLHRSFSRMFRSRSMKENKNECERWHSFFFSGCVVGGGGEIGRVSDERTVCFRRSMPESPYDNSRLLSFDCQKWLSISNSQFHTYWSNTYSYNNIFENISQQSPPPSPPIIMIIMLPEYISTRVIISAHGDVN